MDESGPAADTQPAADTEIPVDPENLNHFEIVLGDPVVVAQGDTVEKLGWGPYQFPSLTRLNNGKIECSFSSGPDNVTSYEYHGDIPNRYVSEDGGVTWKQAGREDSASRCSQIGFAAKNAYAEDGCLSKYTPVYQSEGGKRKLYYAKDVFEFDQTAVCYDYKDGKQVSWTCEFLWDYMPVVSYQKKILIL